MSDFSALGLAEPMLQALAAAQYTVPTPIQAKAIPDIIAGHDIIGIADTGTGKTAAFCLPILHKFSNDGIRAKPGTCRALILCPTRELAVQIADSLKRYSGRYRPRIAVIVGGTGYGPQMRHLRGGVEVLVATPGRLEDLMGDGHIRLGSTEILVADEADRMLDLGFLPAIKRLSAALPTDRQNLFFSATMPANVRRLANGLLRDPLEITVEQSSPPMERIEQGVIAAESKQKGEVLIHLLRDRPQDLTLVFTRTKRGADRLARQLCSADIPADAMHGNKSQNQRQRILGEFRKGRTRVLVATDLAARGIDIDGINLVVNYDLPNVAETYVHRIGRTARAGTTGRAVSFCSREERPHLIGIEKLIKCRIPQQTSEWAPALTGAASQEREEQPARSNSGRPRPDNAQPHRNGGGRKRPHRGSEARNAENRAKAQRAGETATDDSPRGDVRDNPVRKSGKPAGNRRPNEPRAERTADAGRKPDGNTGNGRRHQQRGNNGQNSEKTNASQGEHPLESMPFLRRRPADGTAPAEKPARRSRRGRGAPRQQAMAS